MKCKTVLFAESPWDNECYRKVFGEDIHTIYLYNFEKVGRRTLLYRIFYFSYMFILFSFFVLMRYRILVSDMNREGLTLLNIGYKKSYAFIPNLLVKGSGNSRYIYRNKVLNKLLSERRVFFSDCITTKIFGGSSNETPLVFDIDNSDNASLDDKYIYLIILPGTFSHHQTCANASDSYEYLLKIGIELIEKGFKVKFKPHPRDWRLYAENIISIVPEHFICHKKNYSTDIIYISYFSSVSLNKRYGKGLGFWLCDDYSMALKDGLEELFPFSLSKAQFYKKIER